MPHTFQIQQFRLIARSWWELDREEERRNMGKSHSCQMTKERAFNQRVSDELTFFVLLEKDNMMSTR